MKKLLFVPSMHLSVIATAFAAYFGLAGTAAIAQGVSNDDPELAFNGHCRECHAFDKGDNRIGPSLYGVVGRKAGTVPGFAYSDTLKNSGLTWTETNLDAWIKSPDAFLPGNNMGAVFPGLPDESERKKIITFLKGDTKTPGSK